MPKIFTLGDMISEISSEIKQRKEEYSIITKSSEVLVKNKITAQDELEGCDALILSSSEKRGHDEEELLKYKEFFDAAKKMGIPILGTRKGKVFVEYLEQLDNTTDDKDFVSNINERFKKYNELSRKDKRALVYSNIINRKGQLRKDISGVNITSFLRQAEHQQRQKEIKAAGKSALEKADKVTDDKQTIKTDPISQIKHSNSIGVIKKPSEYKNEMHPKFAHEAVQKELQEKVANLGENLGAKFVKQNIRARDKTLGSLEAKYKNIKKKEQENLNKKQKALIREQKYLTNLAYDSIKKQVFKPITGAIEEGYEPKIFTAVREIAIVGNPQKCNDEIQTMQDLKIKSETLPYSQFDRFFSKQSKQLFRTENAVNRDKKIQYAQDVSHADAATLKKDFTETLKNIDELWGEAKQGAEKFLADKDGLVIAGTNTDSADRILATQALIHVAREKKIPLLGLEKGHQLLENLSELSDRESKNRVRQCIEEARDISKSWERASKWANEAKVDEKDRQTNNAPLKEIQAEKNVALWTFFNASEKAATDRVKEEVKSLNMSNLIKIDNGQPKHAPRPSPQQRGNQNNILQR